MAVKVKITTAPRRRPSTSRSLPTRKMGGMAATAAMVSERPTWPSLQPRSVTAKSFQTVMGVLRRDVEDAPDERQLEHPGRGTAP
jgi:hypothetical protein